MARARRLTVLGERLVSAVASVPPGPLVVALSGGADSAAAAWAVREAGRDVRAVHVHHGLPPSDRLAAAAEAVARALGIPLATEAVAVPPGPSPEAAARAVRYAALDAHVLPGELVVTAHTADDQAETVLAHLLRGAGFDGLAGIPPLRAPYVRPFLGVSRAETRELADLARLPWVDDPGNGDLSVARNLLRRRLIPLLEAEAAGGLRPALVRSAAVVRTEVAVLDRLADAIPVRSAPGGFRLAAGELVAAEPAVAARAVRRAFAVHRPPHPADSREVEAVLAVARGAAGADLAGGWHVGRDGASVVVSRRGRPSPVPGPVAMRVPGAGTWGGYRFEAAVTARRPVVPLSRWALVVPLAAGEDEVLVRAAGRTDRIAVPGGHKRVVAALAEGGVEPAAREGWPVVCLGDEVVWVPGVRRAGWRLVGAERYLCVEAVVAATGGVGDAPPRDR